jgi:hypothetical protein
VAQLLILPIANHWPPRPSPKNGPAKIICLSEHEVRLGPYWHQGVKVLVCRRCGMQWGPDGLLDEGVAVDAVGVWNKLF